MKKQNKSKLFDVLIVGNKDGHIQSRIGMDLTKEKANKRELSGIAQCDLNYFYVTITPAGKYKVGGTYRSRRW